MAKIEDYCFHVTRKDENRASTSDKLLKIPL